MIRLTLLSQSGIDYDGEVERFQVETSLGPLEVSGGYADCYELLLDHASLKISETMGVKAFAVHLGVLEVKDGRARILCSYDEEGGKIDVGRADKAKRRAEQRGRADKAKRRAEQRLAEKAPDLDWQRASASLSRALSRLKAARIASGGK